MSNTKIDNTAILLHNIQTEISKSRKYLSSKTYDFFDELFDNSNLLLGKMYVENQIINYSKNNKSALPELIEKEINHFHFLI